MNVSDDDEEQVILVCTNTNSTLTEAILVSIEDTRTSDLLGVSSIKVKANRNRLMEQSEYFRSLLSGNFSESCLGSTIINWNVCEFMQILKHMYGFQLDLNLDNVLPLYEGALYFGVETLVLKCEKWLSEVFSPNGLPSTDIQMEDLIQFWNFGSHHANGDFIKHLCTGYLARNFMLAKHSKNFWELPYDLLLSSVKHPHLTVDSEMHLSDALLLWIESNMENLERPSEAEDNCNGILKQIRVGLLPLWFAVGKRNSLYFRQVAEESLDSIFRLLNVVRMDSLNIFEYSDLQNLRIRLTEYSKNVNLSDCPQMTSTILFLSLVPPSFLTDPMHKKIIQQFFVNGGLPIRDKCSFPQQLEIITFNAVQEVDISKCQNLDIQQAVDCFCKFFPYLTVLKATYLLNVGTSNVLHLLEKSPLVSEIDLTVDITPLIPTIVTVLRSFPAVIPLMSEKIHSITNKIKIKSSYVFGPSLSNVTKLTLEGRTDVDDLVLHYISTLCVSLHHLNIKGCISVTDISISKLIGRCRKLNSIVVCDTLFGINSAQALCSAISDGANFETLHIGGCRGISESSLLELMSQTRVLRSLCLRETDLVDEALYNFGGSSLEMLDISNTKISGVALAHVICGNPSLKCLKARGCRNLFTESSLCEELHAAFGRMSRLEEIAFGWGFSSFSLTCLGPALMLLKSINIGLGGMLDEDALRRLPAISPLLETVILYFQVISDVTVTNFVTSLINLQVLALCYCFGDISISSFKFPMQNLRKLRLERVTPWMTKDNLVVLTQNCRNLVELSLLGCSLLNPDSLQIISRGWPGLVSIHLEECGELTANGVTAILDCIALEDLLLRHNGCGLNRNFISDAVSQMPLLRKLSLDICDASDGDYDIPECVDRCLLGTLKIARCKSPRCAFNIQRRSVHDQTLVLVRNSGNLIKRVVKERL